MATIDRTKLSGIYLIENMRDGKVYVGQAGEFAGRWRNHKKYWRQGKNSPHLQRAWKKYGEKAFRFEILEVCKKDRDVLNQREQFWMDFFLSYDPRFGYNIAPVAGSRRGSKASKETRKKISEHAKTRVGDKNANYGNRWNDEQRARMSAANKGKCCGENNPNYGKHLSDEAKEKLRQAQLGRKHSDEVNKKKGRSGETNPNYGNGYKVAGEKSVNAKLTWEKAREIRQKYNSKLASMDSLALEYGVGRSTIGRLIHGVTWREENCNKQGEI